MLRVCSSAEQDVERWQVPLFSLLDAAGAKQTFGDNFSAILTVRRAQGQGGKAMFADGGRKKLLVPLHGGHRPELFTEGYLVVVAGQTARAGEIRVPPLIIPLCTHSWLQDPIVRVSPCLTR